MILGKHKDICAPFQIFLTLCLLVPLCLLPSEAFTKDLLSPQARKWLTEHDGVIRLAPVPNYPPVDFQDEHGVFSGLSQDYVKAIEELLGFQFKRVKVDSFPDLIQKLKNREVDVTTSIGINDEREGFLDFQAPHVSVRKVIVARQSVNGPLTWEDLAGKKVVLVDGYLVSKMISEKYPKINYHMVENEADGLNHVALGDAYAMVVDLGSASYNIQKAGITNLHVAGKTEYEFDLRFASRNDWPFLNEILQVGLSSIPDHQREKIYQKWTSFTQPAFYQTSQFWYLISIFFFAIILLLLAALFVRNRLRLEVVRRTKSLHESEEKFRTLAERSPLAIYLFDGTEKKASYINTTFTKLFGYTIDEVPSLEKWWPLAYPDESYRKEVSDEWDRKVASAFNSKSDIEPMETIVTCKDGSTKNIVWGYTFTGQQNWAFGLDVTERNKLMEEQSRSAQLAALGKVAANIAHEINNPTQAIVAFSELIEESSGQEDFVREMAKRITAEGLKIGELVKTALHYSRKETPIKKPADINRILKHALSLLKGRMRKENINLVLDQGENIPNLLVNSREIAQVIINLVNNSIDALDEIKEPDRGKLIQISTFKSKDKKEVQVIVHDNGEGIPETNMTQIKEAFFTTKEAGRGTGLGLSIVDDIMRNHGGTFELESVEGEYTKAILTFPVTSPSNAEN